MTTSQLLEDRLAKRDPKKMDAFFKAGAIAIEAVLESAKHGSVRCQAARDAMMPHLTILLK